MKCLQNRIAVDSSVRPPRPNSSAWHPTRKRNQRTLQTLSVRITAAHDKCATDPLRSHSLLLQNERGENDGENNRLVYPPALRRYKRAEEMMRAIALRSAAVVDFNNTDAGAIVLS
jgi:hypothetical protein